MKPLHYAKKYNLKKGDKFDHKEFVSDFTLDFLALVEAQNGHNSLESFHHVVDAMRQKWDGISNKTLGQLPEKLWDYFYATVIAKTKEELFKEQLDAQRAARKAERDKREAYKRQIKEQQEQFEKSWKEEAERRQKAFFENMFGNALFGAILLSNMTPTAELKTLGLDDKATADDIKSAYRELSKKHHPDRGGNQSKFVEITEAKNKCMAWASKK